MSLQPELWPFSNEPVALDLLEALSPELLCRLLGLFGTAAMYRDALQRNVATGIASLHAALNATIATLPDRLSQVLNAVGDLSSEVGRQNVLLALQSHGNDHLSEVPSAGDLALRTFLDHPAAFDLAYGWAASRGTRRYAVFAGREGPTVMPSSIEMRSRLAAAVREWLSLLQGHSRFDIRLNEATGQVSVLVLYQRGGLAPRTMTGEQGTRFRSLPEFNALATYHSRCGLLCVRAESQPEHHAYRRIFGRALFGDENWFQVKDIFTIDPLVERGMDALSADGLHGVQSTLLRGVEVLAPDRDRAKIQLTAENLSSSFNTPLVQSVLARGTIMSMSLALNLSGFPRPLFARIAPPNRLTLSGQFAQKEAARDFLIARGFMRVSNAA